MAWHSIRQYLRRANAWTVALALILILGVAGSLGLWSSLRAERDSVLRERFDALSHDRASVIQREIDASMQELYAVRSLFQTREQVSRATFAAFVAGLPATKTLQAVEWIPRVTSDERAAYEAKARAEGLPDFAVKELDTAGNKVPAGQRAEYFPVYYVEPAAGNSAALGFDLASEAIRHEALEEARTTGRASTTARIKLVQETGHQWGALIYLPVAPTEDGSARWDPAGVTGFALGVLRTGDLVETPLASLTEAGVDLALWDSSDPTVTVPVWVHLSRTRGSDAADDLAWPEPGSEDGLVSRIPLSVGDRVWTLETRPSPYLLEAYGDETAWYTLAAGLILTALGFGLALLLMHRSQHAQEFAAASEASRQRLEHEVTEREKVEHQLWRSQKMEALGHLAGGIAHDFNNLLTPIAGYADLIARNPQADADSRADATEIVRQAENAASITQRRLAFSRHSDPHPVPVYLNEVVAGMRKTLVRLLGEEIEVEVGLAPFSPIIRMDPAQIEQVIINLALNARDAMDGGGGKLRMAASIRTLQGSDEPLDLERGSYAELEISDNGHGMDEDTIDRMFEPFFTTKTGVGTGLGLSVVYGIVKQAGGAIVVESEPGAGTSLRILLPLSDAEPRVPGAVQPAVSIEARDIEATVLVVEDDHAVRSIVKRVLGARGFTVIVASRPSEAYSLARGRSIDLLLTDLRLPEESGLEVAEKFGARSPGLPVVFMSGYFEEYLADSAAQLGDRPMLRKPFSPDALIAAVEGALAQY